MWVKDMRRLSENFRAYEFQCTGENKIPNFHCCGGSVFIDDALIVALQDLRWKCAVSITINSGCRCKRYNRSLGKRSSDTSSHIRGYAADLAIPVEMTYNEFLALIRKSGLFLGIGLYNGFIHVDTDPNKGAREFDNRTGGKHEA